MTRLLPLLILFGCSSPPNTSGLTWLEGCWDSATPTYTLSECWQRDGAVLSGSGRIDDRPYESTLIAVSAGQLQYVVTRMDGTTTTFTATTTGPNTIRFENPEHDDPKWISYHRDGEDLVAAIGVEATPSAEWRFIRR